MKNIVGEDGRVYSDDEINSLLSKAIENYNYEDFDSLMFDDKPSIIVSKTVTDADGTQKTINRPLNQLSLGQQQSILLAILLQSKVKFLY